LAGLDRSGTLLDRSSGVGSRARRGREALMTGAEWKKLEEELEELRK
jgi:hypothetical protein